MVKKHGVVCFIYIFLVNKCIQTVDSTFVLFTVSQLIEFLPNASHFFCNPKYHTCYTTTSFISNLQDEYVVFHRHFVQIINILRLQDEKQHRDNIIFIWQRSRNTIFLKIIKRYLTTLIQSIPLKNFQEQIPPKFYTFFKCNRIKSYALIKRFLTSISPQQECEHNLLLQIRQ